MAKRSEMVTVTGGVVGPLSVSDLKALLSVIDEASSYLELSNREYELMDRLQDYFRHVISEETTVGRIT